jgi:hypothetical protein
LREDDENRRNPDSASMEDKRKLMLFMERVMNLGDKALKAQYREGL